MTIQAHREALIIPLAQDVHISCPSDLVETLVAEFEHQLTNNPAAEVYDYGWSSKFQQGFIIVSWDGHVPAEFEAQLDADSRLEGHTVYDLPKSALEANAITAKAA